MLYVRHSLFPIDRLLPTIGRRDTMFATTRFDQTGVPPDFLPLLLVFGWKIFEIGLIFGQSCSWTQSVG